MTSHKQANQSRQVLQSQKMRAAWPITRWVIPGVGKQKQFLWCFSLLPKNVWLLHEMSLSWAALCSPKAAVSRWPVTSAGWQFANWSCLSETAAAEYYNQNSADAAVLLKAKRSGIYNHGIPTQISGLLKSLLFSRQSQWKIVQFCRKIVCAEHQFLPRILFASHWLLKVKSRKLFRWKSKKFDFLKSWKAIFETLRAGSYGAVLCCCHSNEKVGLTYCCMKLDELEFTASFDALVGQLIYDQFGSFLVYSWIIFSIFLTTVVVSVALNYGA